MEVEADSIEIDEKVVGVTLHTDSNITPEVDLSIRVLGHRQPPFISRIDGDFTYAGDLDSEGDRTLTVVALEPEKENRPPVPRIDLCFLRAGIPAVHTSPSGKAGFVARSYVFPIRIVETPPVGIHRGSISLEDPWESGRIQRIPVFLDVDPPLKVFPSRLVLNLTGDRDRDVRVRFVALTNAPGLPVTALSEDSRSSPIVVARSEVSEDGRAVGFTVSLGGETPARNGITNVIVRQDASPDVIVPVLVRGRAGP